VDVSTSTLTKAAGAAAAVAGAIFIAVQINHPAMTAASVETTDWLVRSVAKLVMSGLVLVGITGMYLRQHRRVGVLGLVGYLLFATGYFLMSTVEGVAATALPHLVGSEPGYVNDVIVAAAGGKPAADIGGIQTVLNASGAGYMLGGLLFGIALFRSGLLWRWASALLAVATLGTAALAVLPESFNRPFAVPVGLAFLGLGVSLWRTADDSPAAPVLAAPDVAAVR
jgi:hypothetical protein